MDEYPIAECPQDAHWSENFALAGYDPAAGIDVFLHVGRWRKDLSLWRELVTIALPDGSCIAHRAIGNARTTSRGPGGPCFAVEILEPGRRIAWRFLGGARRLPAADLQDAILADGPLERVEFELMFDSDRPLWDLGQVGHKTEFMGRGHVEQIGRLSGAIRIGHESFVFDSLVNRDHSRGPRVFDSNRRHIWMHAIFDNGISFQLYEAEVFGLDAPAYSEVGVTCEGRVYPGRLSLGYRLPFEHNRGCLQQPVPFSIDYEHGRIEGCIVGFPTTLHYHSSSPNDLYIGVRQLGEGQSCAYVEQAARFVLHDGALGYGHVERLLPGVLIIDP